MRRLVFVFALIALAATMPALAAGLMKPVQSSLPDLEIEEHHVKVTINNGFAVTEVDQVFYNPHEQDLDALYSFPLPRDASLSELSLWIDGEEIVGEVVEKERARKIVQEEKAAGRETSLAEQREYYAFDVFVSPVRAASRTRVRLLYLQPIEIDAGVGRYVYPLQEGEIDREVRSFWTRQPVVHGKFSFECTLRSSYPLDDVRANGIGRSVVAQNSPDTWTVWVDGEEAGTQLDEDIVIYYRLAPDLPPRVDLLPYRAGDGPGTFMLVITPGTDLREIVEGTDWIVVLDVSGSMETKLATAADAVAQALGSMRPQDRFRIIEFSNRAQEITAGWTPVSAERVVEYGGKLRSLGVRGGTNLFAGFTAGLKLVEEDRTSALILVSDGGANAGPTGHAAFLEQLEKKDVRVFTFVIGQGANRPLLGRLAADSGGFSMDVSNKDDLYGRLIQARAKLAHEALHGVRVELDGVRVIDRVPEHLPSAYFGQQIVMFGRYVEPGEATLRLSGRISGEEKSWETRIVLPERDETFPEIERLRALARIHELQDRIEVGGPARELRSAVVDLGTEYSIVSDYTSMIVVRKERYDELGIERKNEKRTERERSARVQRSGQAAVKTRADRSQPMFGNSRSHGNGGAGALGPGFAVLLVGLYGARLLLQRRRGR